MSLQPVKQSFVQKYLTPGESLGEILFGLIMVLTFTLTAGIELREEGREGARQLLIATIGCNLAWGLIDGVMYLMNCLFDRSRRTRIILAIQRAKDQDAALAVIERELNPALAAVTSAGDRTRLYESILSLISRATPEKSRVEKEDLYGALASFLMVFLSTIPAAVPFMFISQPYVALRVSNFLLIAMLFFVGYKWAQYTQISRFGMGFGLMLIGLVLVALAVALGG
jgi:hypothetical protein